MERFDPKYKEILTKLDELEFKYYRICNGVVQIPIRCSIDQDSGSGMEFYLSITIKNGRLREFEPNDTYYDLYTKDFWDENGYTGNFWDYESTDFYLIAEYLDHQVTTSPAKPTKNDQI